MFELKEIIDKNETVGINFLKELYSKEELLNISISNDFKLEIKDYTKFDILYSLTTLDFNEFEDVLKQKLKEYNIYVY